MDFQDNPRLAYSPIGGRPDFSWPGGKRLAVYFALCVEHFSYGSGLGLAYSPGLSHPNSYKWGWREYGNRVGGFRLADLFDAYRIPLTILLNTRICSRPRATAIRWIGPLTTSRSGCPPPLVRC